MNKAMKYWNDYLQYVQLNEQINKQFYGEEGARERCLNQKLNQTKPQLSLIKIN